MAKTKKLFKDLKFSAVELRQEHPDWSDAFIEDYLNRQNNENILADLIDDEIEQNLEEISTSFSNGSIPFVYNGFLEEDNTNLTWTKIGNILSTYALIINNLVADRIISVDSNKKVESVADLTAWIAGITDKITVVDDGDGTITLSISDNFLPNGVAGTSNKITVADDGDGTVTLSTSNNFLPNGITGSDLRPVDDDGDGTVSFRDDELEFYIQAVA